jgi:peptidoglycan/xylan/chitin deacetylase (PgdA/CDA1 family)
MLSWSAGPAAAEKSNCSERGALGTSRVLEVASSMPPVGRKHFPKTLPLADKEVVLTFDDGPLPTTTSRILDVLARECVRATFFMVGRMALNEPGLVKRVQAAGHTLAYHSYSHPVLSQRSTDAAMADVERGFATVDAARQEGAAAAPRTRFFRFPGFASTRPLLDRLVARRTVVFGADVWASDWNRMSPGEELQLVMSRLKASHGGILVMHDTKRQTAAMLPALLRRLKSEGFKVVHVVPAAENPQAAAQR